MSTFFARRRGHTIVPNSVASMLEMEKLPEGKVFRVEAVVPRSGKFHRLIFALFSLTAAALNEGPAPSATPWDAEAVARLVKIATGHVDIFQLPPAAAKRYGAKCGLLPRSMSYDAMDQTAFTKFAEAAMHYIRTDLCPYIEQSPHWAEIAKITSHFSEETTDA